MKLSIITITYNHEKFIATALDSFLGQTWMGEIEIVVSDDCSKDNTVEIVRQYQKKFMGKIRLIQGEKNIGPVPNFIRGLTACRGEYVAYCDGDDYWLDPEKISKQVAALENNRSCSFSCHDVEIVTYSGQPMRLHSQGRSNQNWQEGIVAGKDIVKAALQIPHANAIVFRNEFMDEKFLQKMTHGVAGDYPLTVMLASAGDAYYFKDVMSAYRQHPLSVSSLRGMSNNDEIIREVLTGHAIINEHYNNMFRSELRHRLQGELMKIQESHFNAAIDQKKPITALRHWLWMLVHATGSQYTVRDVLWILRDKCRSFGKAR